MRLLLSALAVLGLGLGCQPKPPPIIVPPLPSVEITDVPAPAEATVVIPQGSNLRHIAKVAYGADDFSGFVAELNGIPDPAQIIAGTTLKTPSLAVGLRDAGLDPAYQPAFNALAQTWSNLRTLLPNYERERDDHRARDGETFPITPDLSRQLLQCADTIDAAIHVLSHPQPGHRVPQSTLGQFGGTSSALRRFATGRVDSRDYEVFMAQQGFGLGFTYALIWVHAHHQ